MRLDENLFPLSSSYGHTLNPTHSLSEVLTICFKRVGFGFGLYLYALLVAHLANNLSVDSELDGIIIPNFLIIVLKTPLKRENFAGCILDC